jgi:hypothetical protein
MPSFPGLPERAMVDRLKKSLDELTVPECANCRIEMKWYRSEMDSGSGEVVRHFFYCGSCGGFAEKRSAVARSDEVPPRGKLSLPGLRAA